LDHIKTFFQSIPLAIHIPCFCKQLPTKISQFVGKRIWDMEQAKKATDFYHLDVKISRDSQLILTF